MTPYNFLTSEWRRVPRRALLRGALCTGLSLGISHWAYSQDVPNSSLFSGRQPAARLVRQQQPTSNELLPAPTGASPLTNWYEVPVPPPKQVKVQDIITIRVDTGARLSTSAQLQNRHTSQYDFRLNDWVILEGLRAVKPAPQSKGDQRIQDNLNQLDRATAQLDTTESLKFEIASKVAAVLPNGNIVLEAHRSIRNNDELWMHSLSGECRREDIQPGNIVLSKDIANLQLEKRELGHMRDAYKRGWITRWFDTLDPF